MAGGGAAGSWAIGMRAPIAAGAGGVGSGAGTRPGTVADMAGMGGLAGGGAAAICGAGVGGRARLGAAKVCGAGIGGRGGGVAMLEGGGPSAG